jgi:multidrug resistance efflux pump
MLELVLCSLFTIVPDYLYRRYREGKRLGHEITLYSVWFELRWGITSCLILTVLLITIIFYYHPSTSSVNAIFRTVPILPEVGGRVSEIYIDPKKLSHEIEKRAPIFKLDSSKQEAALELAKRRIVEVDAQMVMAKADIAAAEGQIQQAKGGLQQALDELRTKQELRERNAGVVSEREIERLQVAAQGRKGQVTAAEAVKQTTVYAGVSGRVEQFTLRVGDIVNPLMRPAGILVANAGGRDLLVAGFGQIESQVIKTGMIAEATCVSKPLSIIPMVVTGVQGYVASGQVRAGEQLVDVRQLAAKPGTLTAILEPLYEGGLEGVTPGSNCIANAYTNNHERFANENMNVFKWLYLHIIDAVAVVHAIILRAQALLLPIKALVFTGGH